MQHGTMLDTRPDQNSGQPAAKSNRGGDRERAVLNRISHQNTTLHPIEHHGLPNRCPNAPAARVAWVEAGPLAVPETARYTAGMDRQVSIRAAYRVFIITVAIRVIFGMLGIAAVMTVKQTLPIGAMRFGPTLVVLVLALPPLALRRPGTHTLLCLLMLDILVSSRHLIPIRFMIDMVDMPIDPATLNASFIEPFMFLLIPIVLMAWAYGRRGALLGSSWATFLQMGTLLWNMLYEPLHPLLVARNIVSIVLIYAIPLMVAFLAERERRYTDELQDTHQQLRRYAAANEQLAVSRERNRMARDLHDTLAHSLAALTIHLDALRTAQAHDPELAQQAADEAVEMARRGLAESREAIQALRSDPVTTLGLAGAIKSALQAMEARTGIEAQFSIGGEERDLSENENQALYRIAEESMANIERHADAKRVVVRLGFGQDRVDLLVRDDGTGFDVQGVDPNRYGLTGMRERAAMVGAELTVHSEPERGTEVWMVLEK